MKVSQTAIDEVRAVRSADEAELRPKKIVRKVADCCANCSYGKDRLSFWHCDEYGIDTKPYLICNDYKRRT